MIPNSHRQPSSPTDVASGGASSLVPRWRLFRRDVRPDLATHAGGGFTPAPAGPSIHESESRPAGGFRASRNSDTAEAEAGSGEGSRPLFIASAFFLLLTLPLLSGPIPGLEMIEPGRIVMGMVYGIISGLFLLAPVSVPMWTKAGDILIAWAKRRQWSKRELRALVAQLEGAG